jgi:hypothetical protein
MTNKNCPDCKGAGIVKDKNGTIHTCWKCLQEGQMEQHSKEVKDSGIKL